MGTITSVRSKFKLVPERDFYAPICDSCKVKTSQKIVITPNGIKLYYCLRCVPHIIRGSRYRIEEVGLSTVLAGEAFRQTNLHPNYKKNRLDSARKKAKRATKAEQEQIQKFREKLKKNQEPTSIGTEVVFCSLCKERAQWIVVSKKLVKGKEGRIPRCDEHMISPRNRPPWVKSIEKI